MRGKFGGKIFSQFQRSDVVLALFVLAITAMLLIPVPTWVIDALLVLNISFSLLLLVVSLYLPNALSLLAFPSLLLLTTLFRLSLNIASTRLILSQGDAGQVIQAFGTFLIRGEVIVGVIIFTIITVVNFIVIARGAGRVSEVAARFALDALPGKQMAIDSDLRAGLITAAEAERRRESLRQESQLFGAMDGAMKFVQGDAIAGFFIIFVNIAGGLVMGMLGGLSLTEAIQTYTILTVGDGLVTQVPALLISICAGIVVTRVASDDQATLGKDLGQQIFERTGAIYFAGILLIGLAFVSVIPSMPFLSIGILLLGLGYFSNRLRASDSHEAQRAALVAAGATDLESGQIFRVELDEKILFPAYRIQEEKAEMLWREQQRALQQSIGLQFTMPVIQSNPSLSAGRARLVVDGRIVWEGEQSPKELACCLNPAEAKILGLPVIDAFKHPLDGLYGSLLHERDQSIRTLRALGMQSESWLAILFARLISYALKNSEILISTQRVFAQLKKFERDFPGFLQESVPAGFVNPPRLQSLLNALVKDFWEVADISWVLEEIAAYCSGPGKQYVEADEFQVLDIILFIRSRRGKSWMSQFYRRHKTLRALSLHTETEQLLFEASTDDYSDAYLFLNKDIVHFQERAEELLSMLRKSAAGPVVILVKRDLFARLYSLLQAADVDLPVLTLPDISSGVEVEFIGSC